MLHFKKSQKGRTMLEMLMVLAMIGIMALGGYASVRYGMNVLNSWTVQQQVTDLSKGVEALYAWESDYRNLSMSGSRGICENITLGTQKCNGSTMKFSSPWGGTIEVTKGQSNASYKIIYSNAPKIVCNQLQDMKWTGVYLQTESCDSSPLTLVFSAEKSDGSCTEPCQGEQVCRSGVCVCANGGIGEKCIVPNKCPGMSCAGECNTGECKDNRCVQKTNGTACSSGVCRWGNCESNVTEPPEETVTEEETIIGGCGSNSIKVAGKCYSCTQTDPIYAYMLDELEGCSNRSIGCGTVGSIFCESYLKSCPSGYYLTQSNPGSYVSCNSNEVKVKTGGNSYDDGPDGCCSLIRETTTEKKTTIIDTATGMETDTAINTGTGTETIDTAMTDTSALDTETTSTTTIDTAMKNTETIDTATKDTATIDTATETTTGFGGIDCERAFSKFPNVCITYIHVTYSNAVPVCSHFGMEILSQANGYTLGNAYAINESAWVSGGEIYLKGSNTYFSSNTSSVNFVLCKDPGTTL